MAKEIFKTFMFFLLLSFKQTRSASYLKWFSKHPLSLFFMIFGPKQFVQEIYLIEDSGIREHVLDIFLEDGPQMYITIAWMALSNSTGQTINIVSLFFTMGAFLYTLALMIETFVKYAHQSAERAGDARDPLFQRVFDGYDVEEAYM